MQINDLPRSTAMTEHEKSIVIGGHIGVAYWPIITDEVRKANHVYDIVTDEVRNAGVNTT